MLAHGVQVGPAHGVQDILLVCRMVCLEGALAQGPGGLMQHSPHVSGPPGALVPLGPLGAWGHVGACPERGGCAGAMRVHVWKVCASGACGGMHWGFGGGLALEKHEGACTEGACGVF